MVYCIRILFILSGIAVELSDEKLEELGLSLVKRDDAGDYYYLPLSKVNEIKSEEKEYQMMNDGANNYIKTQILKIRKGT